ncbi:MULTISPECIES: hypothetical protein [Arthrobacter]|uniref:Choice-of-anchor G family protein n=2 Tax=Arthrobacter TaxID=1663 RepID=A0ABU9KLG7_9MICC|nr:hypothetical protein [Arthrobacter sp. YJM1]MDP5227737.1 hypothetical protein [Arthrobacter sp. YJM1]
MSIEEKGGSGIDRRAIVKGAAWSVPVVAAAVAAPAMAASPTTGGGGGPNYGSAKWDAQVIPFCANNYDLSVLQGLLTGVDLTVAKLPIVGGGVLQLITAAQLESAVEGALQSVLGFTPGATRGFTIKAAEGTILAGTIFKLTNPGGILNLNVPALSPLAGAGVANVATVNTDGFVSIAINPDLPQGNTVNVDLFHALVDIKVLETWKLQLTTPPNDNPTSTDQWDWGSVSAVAGATVDLGTQLGSALTTSITGLLGTLVSTIVALTGLTAGQAVSGIVNQLVGKKLDVQICGGTTGGVN